MAEFIARLVLIPAAFAVWIGQQRNRWREWRRRGRACCTRCHAEVDAAGLERSRLQGERLSAALGLPPNTPPMDGTVMGGRHDISCGVCGTTRTEW